MDSPRHGHTHKPTKTWGVQNKCQGDSVSGFIHDLPTMAPDSSAEWWERERRRELEREHAVHYFILNVKAVIHERQDTWWRIVISFHSIDPGQTIAVLSVPQEKWCISINGWMTETCHKLANKGVYVPVYLSTLFQASHDTLRKKLMATTSVSPVTAWTGICMT